MKNYSRQREEIIKVIKGSYNHYTAEEIYMTVKSKDPAVSRSTIYRNLGELCLNGVVNKISMQAGPDKYEFIREKHNHVICIKCGKIVDFNYEFDYESIMDEIKKQFQIEVSNLGITIEGICDSCKNN